MNKKPISRITWIILGVLVLLGSGFRLINLDKPSFWVEEVKHVYSAKSFLETGEFKLPSGQPYTRAYPYTSLVALAFKLFGVNEFSARLPGAIFGIFSIILIFFVGRNLFDDRVGLVAALFLACLPFEIGWARVCRMYTMFQFLFLLGLFLFYRAFENQKPFQEMDAARKKMGILALVTKWNINWKLLAFCASIFLLSLEVHRLTGLWALSVVTYCLLMFGVEIYQGELSQGIRSKYFGVFALFIAVVGVVGLAFPALVNHIKDLAGFHPYWYQLLGEKNHLFYWQLLVSELKFPIGVFFLIGAIQALLRLNKAAIYLLLCFGVPFVMHSFVFTMKSDKYIFNIFPIFFLIAAFGITNIIESEREMVSKLINKNKKLLGFINKRLIAVLVYIAFFAWLPISRWFFNAFELPTLRSGSERLGGWYTNGAVTHRDWRLACEYIDKTRDSQDAIITSHSLNMHYYLGRVDYIMYRGDYDEVKKYDRKTKDNQYLEPFANAIYIQDLDYLKQIIEKTPRGWLILDSYRFNKSVYMPEGTTDFIKNNLVLHKSPAEDTLVIYSWDTGKKS